MKKIYPFIMIILGSFLEIFYYQYRFTGDGTPLWIAIPISILLTAMLTIISLFNKKKLSWLLIIPLGIYSVICTAGGQAIDLAEKRSEIIIEDIQQNNKQIEINELLSDIEILNDQIEKVSSQDSVKTIWEANKYDEALQKNRDRYDSLMEEKKSKQEKLSILRSEQTQTETIKNEDKTDIYKFYNSLIGIDIKWSQYFLQMLLSFFIALAAPLGLIIINNRKQPEIKPKNRKKNVNQNTIKPEIRKQQTDYSKYVDRWVSVSWTRFRNNPEHNKSIVPKDAVIKYINNLYSNGKEKIFFTDKIYDKIFSAAIDKKVIDKKGIINNNVNEQQAKDLLNKYLKGGK